MLSRRGLVGGATFAAAGACTGISDASAAAGQPDANAQAPGYYRYKLGDFQVTVVTDGVSTYPVPERFVANASKAEVSDALKAAHLDGERISVPYSPIVVDTGRQRVLIDTGTGEANLAVSKGAAGQLQRNLRAAGIGPDDIDLVIISHFHGDHVNGLLGPDGKAAFPKAEITVPEVEWAFWMDDGEMSRAPAGRMQELFKNNRRVFDALGRKVARYAWDKEVVPGIQALGTPGHTPGHTSFLVSSGGAQVFVQSDVTNLPALFARNPGWHAAFDQDGPMAEATRRKVYDRLAADGTTVQGFHYPFPAVANVEKTALGYREVPRPWMPIL